MIELSSIRIRAVFKTLFTASSSAPRDRFHLSGTTTASPVRLLLVPEYGHTSGFRYELTSSFRSIYIGNKTTISIQSLGETPSENAMGQQ